MRLSSSLVRAEVAEALANLKFPHIYPDPESRGLRKALVSEACLPLPCLTSRENILEHPVLFIFSFFSLWWIHPVTEDDFDDACETGGE